MFNPRQFAKQQQKQGRLAEMTPKMLNCHIEDIY